MARENLQNAEVPVVWLLEKVAGYFHTQALAEAGPLAQQELEHALRGEQKEAEELKGQIDAITFRTRIVTDAVSFAIELIDERMKDQDEDPEAVMIKIKAIFPELAERAPVTPAEEKPAAKEEVPSPEPPLPPTEAPLEIPWSLDPEKNLLTLGSEEKTLGVIGTKFMSILAKRLGQLTSAEQLAIEIYGDKAYQTRVSALVRRHRKIIEDDPQNPQILKTSDDYGGGYYLNLSPEMGGIVVAPTEEIKEPPPSPVAIRLNQAQKTITIGEKEIALGQRGMAPKVQAFLRVLGQNSGKPISVEEILEIDPSLATEIKGARNVNNLAYQLRKIIEINPKNPQILRTVQQPDGETAYFFNAQFEELPLDTQEVPKRPLYSIAKTAKELGLKTSYAIHRWIDTGILEEKTDFVITGQGEHREIKALTRDGLQKLKLIMAVRSKISAEEGLRQVRYKRLRTELERIKAEALTPEETADQSALSTFQIRALCRESQANPILAKDGFVRGIHFFDLTPKAKRRYWRITSFGLEALKNLPESLRQERTHAKAILKGLSHSTVIERVIEEEPIDPYEISETEECLLAHRLLNYDGRNQRPPIPKLGLAAAHEVEKTDPIEEDCQAVLETLREKLSLLVEDPAGSLSKLKPDKVMLQAIMKASLLLDPAVRSDFIKRLLQYEEGMTLVEKRPGVPLESIR